MKPRTPVSLAASRKAPRPTQRELDQETTIDTFRVILAALIRKHGTLDTLRLTPSEIRAAKSGQLRVVDQPNGDILLGIRQEGQTAPPRPRLMT